MPINEENNRKAESKQTIARPKQTEEAIKKSEHHFRELINSMTQQFQIIELVYDKEGKPVDYYFREVNSALERLTGKSRSELTGGKTVKQIFGGVEDYWLEFFDKVAKTGISGSYENYNSASDIYYELYAWKVDEKTVATTSTDVSKRKEAEETLKASEARFRSVFENSLDAMLLTKPDGSILSANDAACRLYGMSEEEIKKVGRSGILVQDEKFIAALEERKRTGKVNAELTNKRKDGTTFQGEVASSLFTDADGTVKTSMVIRDITERKKAEEALKNSERKFKTLVENAPDAIMRFDSDLRVLYLNPADLAATGKTLEEFVGKTNEEMGMPPELCKLWNGMFDKAKNSKHFQETEFDFDTPSGKRTFHLRVVPEISDDGSLISYLGISRDITDRKKVEEAFKESERKYREMFNSMTELFLLAEIVYDKNGKSIDWIYRDVNPVITSISGKSVEEVINKSAKELWGIVEQHWLDLFDRVAKTGKSETLENYGQALDIWYLLHAWKAGENLIAAVATDVTAQYKAKEALQAHYEQLEQTQKKLGEYANQMEHLASERAKQLQEKERLAAIGATAGMVGHDIRNPLQAMTSDIYLAKTELASTAESEEKNNIQESLTEIEKNIDYVNKIVQDLQDYARPLNPNPGETDLRLIIEKMIQKNNIPKNINVSVNVEDEAKKVVADADYLNRILYNLVINAVQAMPKGGKLAIYVYKEANDVVISVKDTGVGIPKEIQGKMFTAMFTTKSKGQGFGLPVVKRMTESLGGTVSFESQEGKGTTFTLRLPPQRAKR